MEHYTAKAYDNYQQGSQRFEYFLLGLCVALAVYAGQTLRPQRFGLNSYIADIGAILLLIVCVALGLRRVEKIIAFHAANLRLLEFKERRAALAKFMLEGGSRINPQTSELWRPDDMKNRSQNMIKLFLNWKTISVI